MWWQDTLAHQEFNNQIQIKFCQKLKQTQQKGFGIWYLADLSRHF